MGCFGKAIDRTNSNQGWFSQNNTSMQYQVSKLPNPAMKAEISAWSDLVYEEFHL